MTKASDQEKRIAMLERDRDHLLAVVDILEDISGTLHFADILQSITRKLGDLFGLDRCSIFLAERRGKAARLVASYEDPTIRNHLVDLERYPELKRALKSGETVFIPDATSDPTLKHIKGALTKRGAKTITVIPIVWRGAVIGAMFLRTFRDGPAFSDQDLQFCKVVCNLTARALRNAYRYEQLEHRQAATTERARRANRERVALVEFLRRLLDSFSSRDGRWNEGVLSASAGDELDRLTDVAMTVVQEEGKGR
ncbi:MAG: GAF domain-containing protein [Gemmatimonadetes bacterium]|nr:GAF domain-containing protein [Gemmatimonadota bacterium]